MLLSYVIITRGRRDVLLRSLEQLPAVTGLTQGQWEAVVVDNGSADGTAQAVRAVQTQCPWVHLISLDNNRGTEARNIGAEAARGPVLVFLDDDSRPRPGTITTALAHLKQFPKVAVLGGPIWLPDGRQDASAVPLVPPACGMIARRDVFLQLGGFDPQIFFHAEEYDLVFRVLRAGYEAQRLETLEFDHEKTSLSRHQDVVLRMDLRNNLLLVSRYLPRPLRGAFRRDWLRRYAALLRGAGYGPAIGQAVAQARQILAHPRKLNPRKLNPRKLNPRKPHRQKPNPFAAPLHLPGHGVLSATTIETLFGFERQSRQVQAWAKQHRIKRVVIADYTKTLLVTWRACREADLDVMAIADDNPAYQGLSYKGVPIVPDAQIDKLPIEGVVLSNVNPAHVAQRASQLRLRYAVPVLSLQ